MRPILKSIHNYDLKAFSWCLNFRHRDIAVKLARVVSYSANGPLYALSGALFIFYEHWILVQILALGFAIERLVYFVFKSTFKRNRPPQAIPGYRSVIEPSDKFSFPSGHTSAAFLVAWAVIFAYPWSAILLLPWAAAVGLARVFLGVHFPTDVVAGALMGSTICWSIIQIL